MAQLPPGVPSPRDSQQPVRNAARSARPLLRGGVRTLAPGPQRRHNPPMDTPCLPARKRLPCTRTAPKEMLPGDIENVGMGAHGNLSSISIVTFEPVACRSRFTSTLANSPELFSRSFTTSIVSAS